MLFKAIFVDNKFVKNISSLILFRTFTYCILSPSF